MHRSDMIKTSMGTGYLNTQNQRYPQPGDMVKVAEKKNYNNGILTEGIVKDVLTKKRKHPRGHKVRLEDGIIGRVQEFVETYSEKEHDQVKEQPLFGPDDVML